MAIAKQILVATTNPGKVAELRAMLEADVKWLSLAHFPDVAEVKEDGFTFTANACKKAVGYAKATNLWTIADDSGLVIDALQGGPGIESARFCGSNSKDRKIIDKQNIEKVLNLLEGVPPPVRTARFVCCLCLASPYEILIQTQGKLEGFIIDREIGENGFGYDPIFYVPQLGRTVAELIPEEKNAISHRGIALRKLNPLLNKLLKRG